MRISENRYDLSKQLPNHHTDEVGDLIKWFNAFTSNLEKEQYQAELKYKKNWRKKANHAKDIFLASISHELRTPLNGVISSLNFYMIQTWILFSTDTPKLSLIPVKSSIY